MSGHMDIPFFRPRISEAAIGSVGDTLRSGWLTTGSKVRTFEERFAAKVGGMHAIAVNSCTAAMHLALEALGLRAGERVLVPTMTFAATAEVVQYLGAEPVLVDCDPETLGLSLAHAAELAERCAVDGKGVLRGIMPVHVCGMMVNMDEVNSLAERHGLWVVEDAAHSFPAAWRPRQSDEWRWCGAGGSAAACFSFYANKPITTGEGGMAVTTDKTLADRMRLMSLHGMSKDAWRRYQKAGSWYYEIVAPGFKYNMTDIAAAIGLDQLEHAEDMRREREAIAYAYDEGFADLVQLERPPNGGAERVHSWHLYLVRLCLDALTVDRARFIDELRERGVATSVHWMPLHLHPHYRERFGLSPEVCPSAAAVWPRLISLPVFPGMRTDEVAYVIDAVREVCATHAR